LERHIANSPLQRFALILVGEMQLFLKIFRIFHRFEWERFYQRPKYYKEEIFYFVAHFFQAKSTKMKIADK
jgi:hypothetical protein